MYLEIPKRSYNKGQFFFQKGFIIRDGGSMKFLFRGGVLSFMVAQLIWVKRLGV